MDSQFRFKEQVARAATKGLKAAMALRRLQMTSPATNRQLSLLQWPLQWTIL